MFLSYFLIYTSKMSVKAWRQSWKLSLPRFKKNTPEYPDLVVSFKGYRHQAPCVPHLSVSKVIQDGGQFSGVAVLALGPKPRVGVPPVYGEPVEPHLSLVRVRLPQTGVKTMDLTPRAGQGTLQQPVVHSQPATWGWGSSLASSVFLKPF